MSTLSHLGWIVPLAIAAGLTLAALGRVSGLAHKAADDGEAPRG